MGDDAKRIVRSGGHRSSFQISIGAIRDRSNKRPPWVISKPPFLPC
jgi:hypothetical protein